MAGFTEAPDPAEVADLAHAPRRDRHRRPRAPARCSTPRRYGLAHEPMPARAPGGRVGPRHVQRRQARRRAAGRARRRSGGPDRADAARPAGPRDASRQGDAGRRRGDARAVPRRAGDDRDPGLADDRGAARGARGAGGGARAAAGDAAVEVVDAPLDGRRWLAARRDAAVGRRRRSRRRSADACSRPLRARDAGRSSAASRTAAVVLDLRTVDAGRRDGDLAAAVAAVPSPARR